MSFPEEVLTFNDPAGHLISAILTTPTGHTDRAALLCHGFLSSKNSSTNKALTRMLIDEGIATLRIDFFGHGESQGPFEKLTTTLAIGQAMASLDQLKAKGHPRLALVGSSFGGLVSILTAAQRQDLRCLALKCPVVDFGEELRLEFGEAELRRWKDTNTIPNILGETERVKLDYAFYEDCLTRIAYEPATHIIAPTLIVQGDKDEHVPLHQSRRLYEALPGHKQLEMISGADHQFTKGEDFKQMTTLMTSWLTTFL
jgi:hypothetical protein